MDEEDYIEVCRCSACTAVRARRAAASTSVMEEVNHVFGEPEVREADRGTDRAPEAAFDGQKKDAGKLRLDLVPLDAVRVVGEEEGKERDTLDLLTRIFAGGEVPEINITPEEAEGVARVLEMGAKKYSERGWEKGIQFSRVYAAGLRHILAEDCLDAESGLPHADHALCNLLFLSRFIRNEDRYIAFDDRPRPFVEMALTHGIAGAYYPLDPTWRRHIPTLECECGESFSELGWAEAGAAYDEHLHDNPDPETEE